MPFSISSSSIRLALSLRVLAKLRTWAATFAGKLTLKQVQVSSLVRFLNVAGYEGSEGILNGSASVDVSKANASGKGEISIFNRSHYEDVLVTRVHKLIDKETWSARIERIREFEALLAENATTIVKYFLHIRFADTYSN